VRFIVSNHGGRNFDGSPRNMKHGDVCEIEATRIGTFAQSRGRRGMTRLAE